MDYKWYAALAYVRANKLNYNVVQGPQDRFGIIASGKALDGMRQAPGGSGAGRCDLPASGHPRAQGERGVAAGNHPSPATLHAGLREILVVEEKRQIIEYQVKEELYNWRDDVRPNGGGQV